MAVTQDSPLYGMACNLKDIEYRLTNEFTCQPHTVGSELIASVIELREKLDDMNNALIDVMPHLEEIGDYSYSDEQRDFEEVREQEGKEPDQHIFYSYEALNDFLTWVKHQDD